MKNMVIIIQLLIILGCNDKNKIEKIDILVDNFPHNISLIPENLQFLPVYFPRMEWRLLIHF